MLVASPLALVLAVLWLGGAASTLAFFPREAAATVATGVSRCRQPTQDQRSELERFMATAPRVPLVIPTDGAKVLIVKFNDYQCPACGQAYWPYKPILAKYAASQSRRGASSCMKDYPLEPRLQRRRAADAASRRRATRRSRCGWPARTTAARRWRSGSTRTSRR